jgi:hypothetical protein
MSFKPTLVLLLSLFFLSACGTSKIKERREQRDKMAQSSKVYCEFINGEQFPDIDVALNIEMAKRCDLEKPFSLSQYNTRSDSTGVVYCCSTAPKTAAAATPAAKKSDKKDADGVDE